MPELFSFTLFAGQNFQHDSIFASIIVYGFISLMRSLLAWQVIWEVIRLTHPADEWRLKYETMTAIIRSTLGEKVLSTLISVTERKMKETAQQ